jgi:ankyrin repeat protein
LLDEEHIDVNLKDKHGETPLMIAVLTANLEAVTLCVSHACNPFFVNKDEESALD